MLECFLGPKPASSGCIAFSYIGLLGELWTPNACNLKTVLPFMFGGNKPASCARLFRPPSCQIKYGPHFF